METPARRWALAFDTANEVIAIGLGRLDPEERRVEYAAGREVAAHRASNTALLVTIEELLREAGVDRSDLATIAVGRGPGSFTGVRIALATAKGLATGLDVPLIGVSTLDAVAWGAWLAGVRGNLHVVADAMRHEVYPGLYVLSGRGLMRLDSDHVLKIEAYVDQLPKSDDPLCGDGLRKYAAELAGRGRVLPEELWTPTGRGLVRALEDAWRSGLADPFDRARHDPAFALPVYTRLSDAEEGERARLARQEARDLNSGVAGPPAAAAEIAADDDDVEIVLRPLDRKSAPAIAALEERVVPYSAWTLPMVLDEIGRADRTWWIAVARRESAPGDDAEERVIGYAGARVQNGLMDILKVAVDERWRRRGIAKALLAKIGEDGRNLGAERALLEVKSTNRAARALYRKLGFRSFGRAESYYRDGSAAISMEGPVPAGGGDVAGMRLVVEGARRAGVSPLLLAIETSCDETAAAIVDGSGTLLANVVASQVDFHARFGGVVPEIASRKHIEAICGVVDAAFEAAGVRPADLDGVAVTYAPGLVGALVVGVAFAKGLAAACGVPLIAVNHLEGHLYANKLADPDFEPPAVVSLVSGGHTLLVAMHGWGDYETLGSTIDDAVGEAFDKVAKALGLPYPGGPAIGRLAAAGDPSAIAFPRAMLHSGDLRFSLSGLKTAVLTYLEQERAAGREPNVADVAASFQQAVIDVQIAKAAAALEQTGAATLALGGGVAANAALRAAYEELARSLGAKLVMAPLEVCGDNASMIALVALDRYRAGKFAPMTLDACAHADLDADY